MREASDQTPADAATPGQGCSMPRVTSSGRRAIAATTVDDSAGGRRDQGRLLPPLRQQGGARRRGRRPFGPRRPPPSSPPRPITTTPTRSSGCSATSTSARIIEGELADSPASSAPWRRRSTPRIPAIRDACAREIFGHAATLEPDIAAAMAARGGGGLDAREPRRPHPGGAAGRLHPRQGDRRRPRSRATASIIWPAIASCSSSRTGSRPEPSTIRREPR